MAFENVDSSSLKSALNSCKSSINYSVSKELINDISNSNVWQSASQKNLKNALDKLVNTRYKDLEDKLDKYISACSYIEEYQNLEKNNNYLESQYNQLQQRLYKTDDSNASEKVKDPNIEYQMNDTRRKINENREKMETLKTRVSNSI